MECNKKGIDLIKSFEGLSLQVYHDVVGLLTVGYGHRTNLAWGESISQETADQLLEQDLKHFSDGVTKLLKVELNENQFSALVSFAYNLGIGSLEHSTLLKMCNQNKLTECQNQFGKWCHAGGHVVPGLVRRRNAERDLFSLPV